MFDKILFEKICNVQCTWDELKNFNSKINEKEFDVDNSFEKYYSFNSIMRCIQLYKDKQITDKYLALWCNAYNWIIMGGFKDKANEENEKIDVTEIIVWDIVDWIDSLSFFDDEDVDFYDLDVYVKNLRILDSLYKNHKKWEVFYSFGTDVYDNDEPVNNISVLFVFKTKKVYYAFDSDACNFEQYVLDERLIKTLNTEALIKDLKAKGYRELS